MSVPWICPAGRVCIENGVSEAVLMCKAGYYCLNGTALYDSPESEEEVEELRLKIKERFDLDNSDEKVEMNKLYDMLSVDVLQPHECNPGTFCLGGVMTNERIVPWVGMHEDGHLYPQECLEGTYCESGTNRSEGTAYCYAGHYCPPGTSVPIASHLGHYNNDSGRIIPQMCLPGTYALGFGASYCYPCPAGHSCLDFGTYVPKVCTNGTYRSAVNSMFCRPCPVGTFSDYTGNTDISLCYPCQEGHYCRFSQTVNISNAPACQNGYICGVGTNNESTTTHLCPAGYACGKASSDSNQYDYICPLGKYCPRGTPLILPRIRGCRPDYFCPYGTTNKNPRESKCPSGMTSKIGSGRVEECIIKEVDTCEKVGGMNYIESGYKYVELGKNKTSSKYIPILNKIIPINYTNSDSLWINDTVRTIRSCPNVI